MTRHPTLDELWDGAPAATGSFDPAKLIHLPESARRYLTHAIAPGTPLSSAVRLSMTGAIKLGNDWHAFDAEQVICWDRGMIWRARVKMGHFTVKGSDRIVDGEGAMDWRIFGLIPVMRADGPDITRSAMGRLEIESVWVPAVLLDQSVEWTAPDEQRADATIALADDRVEVHLDIEKSGQLRSARLARWGNPEGGEFHRVDFGGWLQRETSFGGYTIPTQLRVGWYFGSDRFDSEGEFFRASIHQARYR
ncbi:MAG: hypothetical protein MJE77_08870 [Proteobacteria bacterium]|nr:hypothetical protein [Pseudomonadota bacterium]